MKTNKIRVNMELVHSFVNLEVIGKIGLYQNLEQENKLHVLELSAEKMKEYVTSCGYDIEVPVMGDEVFEHPEHSAIYACHYAYHMYKTLPALYNVVVGEIDSLEFDNLNQATCFMMYSIIPALFRFIGDINESNPELLGDTYLKDLDLNANHKSMKFVNRLLNCRIKVGDKVATANEWADLVGYHISFILDTENENILMWICNIEEVAVDMADFMSGKEISPRYYIRFDD